MNPRAVAGRVTTALALLLAAAAAAQPAPAELPEVRVGDTWEYQRTDLWKKAVVSDRVSRVVQVGVDGDADRYAVETVDAGGAQQAVRAVFRRDLGQVQAGAQKFEPVLQEYAFPLRVGKKWTSRNGARNVDLNGAYTQSVRFEVLAWESITVPAGRFDAYKIEARGTYVNNDGRNTFGGRTYGLYWYAPAVRRAVRYEYRDTTPQGRVWNQTVDQLVRFELVR